LGTSPGVSLRSTPGYLLGPLRGHGVSGGGGDIAAIVNNPQRVAELRLRLSNPSWLISREVFGPAKTDHLADQT